VKTEADSKAGSALHGGIGMGTWDTKAEFRDILVQTSDRKTLLQPYFANGLDGWQKGGGEWVGSGGVVSQNSRAINCQITCGENSWSDYTLSLKARRTEGTEGFLIIFAAEDSKNLYWWNLGGWGDTRTAIEKMTRGGKREIPGTAVDLRIETGTWYDIAITVHGDTADCYFDGKLITRIDRDKGSSSMPDAGPPKVFNNGNGPEPARPAVRTGAGRGAAGGVEASGRIGGVNQVTGSNGL
jgi:alpha-L-arabinofuranosidase